MSVDHSAIERALALGPQHLAGRFRLDLATGAWWWSDEAYLIHGFAPGEVVPSTELVLAHKHPDDRERVRRVLDAGRRTGAPFTSVHRIMDARGRERTLAIVGEGVRDEDGALTGLTGFFVDVTAAIAERSDERASSQIAASARTRGVIEQAKGALAVAFGTDPESAFALLRQGSNDRNVRLRDVAEEVVAAVSEGRTSADALRCLLDGARR